MRYFALFALIVGAADAWAGSVDSGEAPYERCALCHGLFGNTPRAKFPKLAGQNPAYLTRQLELFLTGKRSNDNGQMATVVTEISTADFPEIVAWFSSQEHPQPNEAGDTQGAMLFEELGCSGCHIESISVDSSVPLLSSQHPEYLAKQMRDYRDGARDFIDGQSSSEKLLSLSDEQIEQIAQHLASVPRP